MSPTSTDPVLKAAGNWMWLHRLYGSNGANWVFGTDGNSFYADNQYLSSGSTNAERVVFIEGQVTYKDGSGGTISLPTMGRETLEIHIKGEGFTGVNPTVSRKLLLDQDGKFVIALNRDQLSSAGGVIFLRTGSSLWKTLTVSAQTTHQVVTVNLRYGDIDQNNIIQVQASAPFSGDSAVWNNASGGKVAMDDANIYKFDHRADVDRDMAIVALDRDWLLTCVGTTNSGDSLQ